MNTIRSFLNPGGFSAALICLFVAACGPNGGNSPADGGDAGTPPGDGSMDMPDRYVPPGEDGGDPTPDAGTDSGMTAECTAEMMATRVSPPCDPDTPEDLGPGTGPTGMESFVGAGHTWTSGSGDCADGMETDSMGRIGLLMGCLEANQSPYFGLFYYSTDGNWYANWRNRALPGDQGNHARIVFDADHLGGMMEIIPGGSDVPTARVGIWHM